MKIGIMGAMPQEMALVIAELTSASTREIAGRTYHTGLFQGSEIVVVFSRWGKVAAASTATTLLEQFDVDLVIFSGVAGAVDPALEIGDIVIADKLIQHDFDASAVGIYSRYEIPLLGVSHFSPSNDLLEQVAFVANEWAGTFNSPSIDGRRPRVQIGTVASGDQFIADSQTIQKLRQAIPGLLCIEMEGAAMAQVCHEHSVPFLVLRCISDRADEHAPNDFLTFIMEVARYYSVGILRELIPMLTKSLAKL